MKERLGTGSSILVHVTLDPPFIPKLRSATEGGPPSAPCSCCADKIARKLSCSDLRSSRTSRVYLPPQRNLRALAALQPCLRHPPRAPALHQEKGKCGLQLRNLAGATMPSNRSGYDKGKPSIEHRRGARDGPWAYATHLEGIPTRNGIQSAAALAFLPSRPCAGACLVGSSDATQFMSTSG